MWETLKVVCGGILLLGVLLAVVSTAFIFSWVFKIIGVILAMLVVGGIAGYITYELITGWWQDRREQKKKH